MAQFVMLDPNQHADLKVVQDYRDARSLNQTRVFITEFDELHKEYPIFFRKTEDGAFFAVSILGLDVNENLFLNGSSFDTQYIPAALRRGPFKIGKTPNSGPDDAANIHIDLDDPRVGRDEGNALFEKQGGLSPYLTQISRTLNVINIGIESERAFFAELAALSLIDPVTIQLQVSEEKAYSIPELYTISREKLLAVKGADLERIHQSGLLALCHCVISSMSNANYLLARKLRRSSSAA